MNPPTTFDSWLEQIHQKYDENDVTVAARQASGLELASCPSSDHVIAVWSRSTALTVGTAVGLAMNGWDCAIIPPAKHSSFVDLMANSQYASTEEHRSSDAALALSVYRSSNPSGAGTTPGRILFLTSGTTSLPKLVPFEQTQVLAILESIQRSLKYDCHDKILSAVPAGFDYGFYQALLATHCGADFRQVQRLLFVKDVLMNIKIHQSTVLPITPAFGRKLGGLMRDDGTRCPSVRLITSTGAPLSESTRSLLQAGFPSSEIINMYGLTECKRITITPSGHGNQHPTSVGLPIEGIDLRIERPDGTLCNPNELGEGVVRGPHVAHGYWNARRNLSLDTTGPLRKMGDDWVLYTGDYLSEDADRYIYHHGRKTNDFVKLLDERISLIELEELCRQHSHVRECKVTADLDDDGLVHRIRIALALAPDTDINALSQWVSVRARPVVRKFLYFVSIDELVYNDNGKL